MDDLRDDDLARWSLGPDWPLPLPGVCAAHNDGLLRNLAACERAGDVETQGPDRQVAVSLSENGVRIRVRRGRLLILQETWRVDWRTPPRWPVGVVFTLRRWIE